MKNSVVFLTMFLTVGATCAAPDDAWSLSGNMQTNSNPGPWVNGGRWRYHYDDPSQDFSLTAPPNGYEASLPDEGYGWVASAGSHLALVRFTVDADGGDGTTFRAGQVGGHAVIGASWETDHAGKFLIDYLGYNARVQTGGGADGRETDLVLRVGGIEHERTVITSGVYGSGNPYTKSLTVVLNAGDVIDLTHFQHDAGATDWVGLDMTITELTPGWSLSGNMQTNSNPGPWVNGGRWRYHYDDPSQDFSLTAPPNGYEASLPDEGYGWVASAGSHLALVRFTVDADGGDGTTFRAGQVGGHAVIGASWETDHAGKFLIDYLGYNARVQTGGGADGRETDLVLRVGGIEHERTVITSGVYGSGNPYTKSLTVVLNAGDVIDLTHFQHDAGATDWVGLDMTITPVPATGTIVLIK